MMQSVSWGQFLEQELQREEPAALAIAAKQSGDAIRGAIVFHQQHIACTKCHLPGKDNQSPLGPDLTTLGAMTSDTALVESVLYPSKTIRKGFESVSLLTVDGRSITALLVEKSDTKLVIRDIARGGEASEIATADIEQMKTNEASIMPAGQVNQLHSRQQFLDLVRYLMEIRDGGKQRAMQLQPAASLLTFTVPEYEKHLDHSKLIASWDAKSLERGEAIYQRVCANCHGTHDKPGSLPTSLRFASGKFKNGSDPLSMYRTITYGFGLMTPQTWMVPSQKYDVIHYIREAYLKNSNNSQYATVDSNYLKKLPPGDTTGPEPSKIVPWSAMDYGNNLTHTYEIPGLKHNVAYKGMAIRLDPGAGGVSRGRHWMMFDTDTLRSAVAWNGTGNADANFIDWQGIQFNGAHGVHPRIVGPTVFTNSTGPGWANSDGTFVDEQRVLGRDGRRYGPLPSTWGKFLGTYQYADKVVLSYEVHGASVLESPGIFLPDDAKLQPLVMRTFQIGPRSQDLLLAVAEHPSEDAATQLVEGSSGATVIFAPKESDAPVDDNKKIAFDGNTYLEIEDGTAFDLTTQDFTIEARIKTASDGTLWSQSEVGPRWSPDGQTFFIRDGRLCFDIGWVGAVAGRSKVSDDRWHDVKVTWSRSEQRIKFYVDGKLDNQGKLAAKAPLAKSVVRIGFTTPDFPRPATFFRGQMSEVRFYNSIIDNNETDPATADAKKSLVAHWNVQKASGAKVANSVGDALHATVKHGLAAVSSESGPIIAGFAPQKLPLQWTAQGGKLCLKIPAGNDPLRFSVWLPTNMASIKREESSHVAQVLSALPMTGSDRNLDTVLEGGPSRNPQVLETTATLGDESGPFATDILTPPEVNPWLAQTRFTGLDFFPDGKIAVCTWDGDVWMIDPAPADLEKRTQQLKWRRIATGLFQPLGLKVIREKIHVICRDQLAVLHDLNADGEIDFYQNLNNDHQVTTHFHEFAMGLQTDSDGNFYYAKSGLHGLPAVVPHHGTLLRVSKDGKRTDILATGFRAANGVCLNPDGSFVVTDQEGFWNPKNRINWVTLAADGKPKFYGNMLGYHDVTDSSDSAMEPPLCWITNEFDRSPAELLWVDSKKWGPLNGRLLNLSYGYGKVFLVPHETVGGSHQGGMIELPIPSFPTGVMRGRFSPLDGDLYLCGMFAWAGNATVPGGLYRLRATGKPIDLPVELHAKKSGLQLKFTSPLQSDVNASQFQIRQWSLKRAANYGSKHYDEKSLKIRGIVLSDDKMSATIDVEGLEPTWCMEIKFQLQSADGRPVNGTIHNTIHQLGD